MKLRKLLPISAMLLVVLMTACKQDDEPGAFAVVTSTENVNIYPADNATNVAINSKISGTFGEALDPTTKFTLLHGTNSVSGEVRLVGSTTSFTPVSNLMPNTLYKATITTGQDIAGNNLAYVWSFTTSDLADKILPTVTLTDPADKATGVSFDHEIVITFSEPMDITSLIFDLKRGSIAVPGKATYTRTAATFIPASDLDPNELYTGTITTGAMDMAGNALTTNHTFSFATADIADILSPTITSTGPLSNASCVPRDRVVSVNFSEGMDPSTINSSSFTLTQGGNPVSGTVTYCASCSGTTATFTPTTALAAGTTYCVTITTDAKDLAGNSLEADSVWCFTTNSGGTSSSTLEGVDFGVAGHLVILAKTAITNVPTSAITGDVGLSPAATSFITGFALTASTDYTNATSAQVTGKIYGADMTEPTHSNLTMAVNKMEAVYVDLANRPAPNFTELGDGSIGGKTLLPGLYKWTTGLLVPTDVTLTGCPNDVYIFQIAGNLSVSSAVNITLSGGVDASNIYWVVAGAATLGTTSHVEGNILSMTGINLQTGASLNGRAFAQSAVTLDNNNVTKP